MGRRGGGGGEPGRDVWRGAGTESLREMCGGGREREPKRCVEGARTESLRDVWRGQGQRA